MKDAVDKYNSYKDFITLDAWKKMRLVKLFFYKEVIPHLPPEGKFNLNVQIRKLVSLLLQIFQKDMGVITIRKLSNFIVYQEAQFMN